MINKELAEIEESSLTPKPQETKLTAYQLRVR